MYVCLMCVDSGMTDLETSHVDSSAMSRSHLLTVRKTGSKQLNKTLSPDDSAVLSPENGVNSSRSFILNSSMNGGKRQKLNDRFEEVSLLDDSAIMSPQRTTKVSARVQHVCLAMSARLM